MAGLIALMLIVAAVLGWLLVRWDTAKRDRGK